MRKCVNVKKRFVGMSMAIVMVMSLMFAMLPAEKVEAEDYSDVYYDEGGITITTSGLKAELTGYDAGDWYIELYVQNNTANNIVVETYTLDDESYTKINGYSTYNVFYNGAATVASRGSKYIKLSADRDALTKFMIENNISGVSDIFEISVVRRILIKDDSGNTTETIITPRKSIPLHFTPVSSVSFNKDVYTMVKGQTMRLNSKINVLPTDATNKYTTVASSDKETLSVSGYGVSGYNSGDSWEAKLYASYPGYVTVTATTLDGSKTADCSVEVIKPEDGTAYNIDGEYWVCYQGYDYISSSTRRSALWTGYSSGTIRKINTVDGSIPMYRLYNPNSGEHFYTSNYEEARSIVNAGWDYEGDAWYAPSSGDPVYRMYNRSAGDHHYTMNAAEKDMLVNAGWEYEGVAWYSGGDVSMLRAYNPSAMAGSHHYTSNEAEINSLVAQGWKNEGVAWKAIR